MQDPSFYLTLFAMFGTIVVVLSLFSPKAAEVIEIVCRFLISLVPKHGGWGASPRNAKSYKQLAKTMPKAKQTIESVDTDRNR